MRASLSRGGFVRRSKAVRLLYVGWSAETGSAEYAPACGECGVTRVAIAGDICAECSAVVSLDIAHRTRHPSYPWSPARERYEAAEAGPLPGFDLSTLRACAQCHRWAPVVAVRYHRMGGRVVWRVARRDHDGDAEREAFCARCVGRTVRVDLRTLRRVFVSRAVCRIVGLEVAS